MWRHPPGDEIYRKHSVSVFEVDGKLNKVCGRLPFWYCAFLGCLVSMHPNCDEIRISDLWCHILLIIVCVAL